MPKLRAEASQQKLISSETWDKSLLSLSRGPAATPVVRFPESKEIPSFCPEHLECSLKKMRWTMDGGTEVLRRRHWEKTQRG